MYAKFQVAMFQNERDIRHRSLDFICLLLEHLSVHVTLWFLAPTAVKFRLLWKISNLSNKTPHQIYTTYFIIL